MHVGVGHLKPGDHLADAGGGEGLLLGGADLVRNPHQMRCRTDVEVDPVIDFSDGHDEGMARRDGVDRHEGYAGVVAPHEVSGQVSVDDHREHGRHQYS